MINSLKKRAKSFLLNTVWNFGPQDLVRVLRRLGVHEGDALMVHSGWRIDSGFQGSCQDLVQAFIDAVGPKGTLCMMSIPFHAMTAAAYLEKKKRFDVRKTVSMVGLPSELFRRRKDVVRSLHPTHPVVACGAKAEWLTQGHENCLTPFGVQSPFEKIAQIQGKIMMYDVPFNTMTFEHYLEDRFANKLPFVLYADEIRDVECIDVSGDSRTVRTKVLAPGGNRYRKTQDLYNALKEGGALFQIMLKRVPIIVVDTKRAIENMDNRESFYG